MFCSTGSEGHLVLFVPLDIRACHTQKAHLCTDMCYTLTPVMQTSHNSSCNIVLTVRDLDWPFDRSFLRNRTKTEVQWGVPKSSIKDCTCHLIAQGVVEGKVFVDSVLIIWISTLKPGVWWNPFVSSVSFLFHCGFQWPVTLSHQPSLDTKKTPNQAVNPPGQ